MNRKSFIAYIFCIFFISQSYAQSTSLNACNWVSPHALKELKNAPVALIPYPRKAVWKGGFLFLKKEVIISIRSKNIKKLQNATHSLQRTLLKSGIESEVDTGLGIIPGSIRLGIDTEQQIKHEGYTLNIDENGVRVTGKDAAGAFYGIQTLKQLLMTNKGFWELPRCKIIDWPAFSLRGFMFDTGRNFLSLSTLKELIDRLSSYKFNTFHWHLTDNPAWRPQSNLFPELNNPKNRRTGRDPDSTYSFDEIREVIKYASERYIQIIPELDMPGHSEYFEKTFGFAMWTEKGMEVLEKLIDEFCREIPMESCPIIHLGSDEVNIPNPKEFMDRMTNRLKMHGRTPMVWSPGLKPPKGTILQIWINNGYSIDTINQPFVDSYSGYLNLFDPLTLIRRYFFQQPCNQPNGDTNALGGIVCCWPDVRVDDKRKVFEYNPIWPGIIAYSEAVWCGRSEQNNQYMSVLPRKKSEAWKYFHEFELRLAEHRDRFFKNAPFPFVVSSEMEWLMIGPFYRKEGQKKTTAFAPEPQGGDSLDSTRHMVVTGGVITVDSLVDPKSLLGRANQTVYLRTNLYSQNSRTIHAWIGFETPNRSNRRSAGIPKKGKWDANGGTIWVNDKKLPAPIWKKPGRYRYLHNTWFKPANEIPYTDEEFYWSRPPASIKLKRGWNQVLVRVPRTYKGQKWMFAFVPVKKERGKWVEDLSIKVQVDKNE